MVRLGRADAHRAIRADLRHAAPGILHPPHRRRTQECRHHPQRRSLRPLALLHHGRSLKAGEYLFDKPANIIDIQKRLRRGDVYFHTVVVPEGFTMFDIARAVEAAGLGPADDFLKVAQSDTALIADIAPGARSLEGYLFPETYEFSRMMTMHDMAAAMVKQFRQVAHQMNLISAESAQARLRVVVDRAPQADAPGLKLRTMSSAR